MTVQWCDPPVGRVDGWPRRLAPVMERPGMWALVSEYRVEASARGAVRDLRIGRLHSPPGSWEFRSSRTGELYGVWAKYVGPNA